MCKHGMLPCTCKPSDEDYCHCLKCITRLMERLAEEGELIAHGDGTYSLKE